MSPKYLAEVTFCVGDMFGFTLTPMGVKHCIPNNFPIHVNK